MYDHNVLAVLTAVDDNNKARSAFGLPENARWFRKAIGGVAEKPTIDSKEPTPAPDASSPDQDSGANDCLVITFDKLLETLKDYENGLQFGTHPGRCDVLLGHRGTRGISGQQYNITMDNAFCFWLNDYHSTHGTAVVCNSQDQLEVRKKDTWILADRPGSRKRLRNVKIHSGGLIIKIEFPNHEAAHPGYIENLRAFVKKSKEKVKESKEQVLAVKGLGLDSDSSTATPSQAQTPSERPVYYIDKKVGKGAFGEVHRLIKARDGKYFAAKSFMPPTNKRKHDEVDPVWLAGIRREFTIMKNNPHVNVAWL